MQEETSAAASSSSIGTATMSAAQGSEGQDGSSKAGGTDGNLSGSGSLEDKALEPTKSNTELLREHNYPHHVPAEGVGSSVGHHATPATSTANSSARQSPLPNVLDAKVTQPLPSNAHNPSYFPPYSSPPSVQDPSKRNPVSRNQSYTTSTDGIQTPSTSFGYSPNPTDLPQNTSSSLAESQSPDWLPSPVTEEREDELSSPIDIINKKGSQSTLMPDLPAASLTKPASGSKDATGLESHLDDLSLQGITVAPSTRGRTAAPSGSTAVPSTNGSSANARTPSESSRSTVPSSSLSPNRQAVPATAAPVPARAPSTSGATGGSRPEMGHKKQSVFGKLFHHKDKHHDAQSNASSGYSTPDHTHHGRPTMGSRQSSTLGQDTNDHHGGAGSQPVRQPSTNGREKDAHTGAFSGFLHNRRLSNKKMEKPDPVLAAMASAQAGRSATSTPDAGTPANASSANLTSSSDLTANGQQPAQQANRGVSPSPARQPEAKPMSRRPSSSSHTNGDTTPHLPGGGQPVREKTLKEHLAALGSSAGIGKLNRKTSQTSRRSDDGRSERSHHEDEHPVATTAAAGGSGAAPKRAPSVGGQSNASTSLTQKYGVCEKVAIGKGATAVVRLAHKWDRSTEKLYAVKEFRKRRKNETEKEYVKKLTSEFCISSTLHHINVVETVDLVQNEEKHWCEVMEYCPGGDLYTAIKKGDMPAEQMNNYFKQIITGVAYLHSMGVAHRDIKPENLLLDNQGHVKITDFGVSDVFRMCWEKQTHMSKGLCGSEPYIAPEQFEQKEYDARLVDVWACAVVFYCMQAQELPWRVAKPTDPSFQSYIHHYPNSPSPPPLGNLHPKECRTVIKKMLDPNPKTRIGMDQVLADPWMKSIAYEAPASSVPAPLV